ncbi:MAG: capsular biosynthesis protein, partial [Colwellia sp.]
MIVIPMAGLSSRFFKAGYTQPKYMLEAHGETLFSHSIKSFSKYFETDKFVFIVRDAYKTPMFVNQSAKDLGIKEFEIVVLEQETRGQAETVALGLSKFGSYEGALTIFNIDTFRPNFVYPDLTQLGRGYLEVFRGSGDNWSFAKPLNESSTLVIETAEKKSISELCCTGLYHFKDIKEYFIAYDAYIALPVEEWVNGELYIAPL